MHTISLAIAATASLALAQCSLGGKDHHDPSEVTAAIKAKEAQWQKDYESKNVDALAAQYRDDAAMAGPGDPLATTDADRRKILQQLVSDPNFALNFSANRIIVAKSGDMATSRGTFTMTMTDKATNKPAKVNGYYLTVYKLQDDGSWKAVEDFITPGPASAPAEGAAEPA